MAKSVDWKAKYEKLAGMIRKFESANTRLLADAAAKGETNDASYHEKLIKQQAYKPLCEFILEQEDRAAA